MNITKDNKNVSKTIIEKVQQMIINGELHEGDKLPPERELNEMLGVGRPALREALKALELLGLVESRHGLGNYIVNNVQENYFKPMSLSFKLNHGTSEEILELRHCLEGFAVQRAAQNATASDVFSLRYLLSQMIEATTPNEKAVLDKAMHFEIARISNNQLVFNTLENLSFLMNEFIEHSVEISYFEGDSIENIYNEHMEIIDAIENRDGIRAEKAMQKHLGMIDIQQI